MTTSPEARDDARRAGGARPPTPPGRRLLVAGVFLLLVPIIFLLIEQDDVSRVGLERPEWILLGLLLLARLAVFVRSGLRLFPLLDLPLLGFVFVATGGEDSPLDPALFFVYALLALYLGRAPLRRRNVASPVMFLVGIVVMSAIVVVHDYRSTRQTIVAAREELGARVDGVRASIDDALFERGSHDPLFENLRRRIDEDRREDELVAKATYFQRTEGEITPTPDTFDGGYEEFVRDLEERSRALASVRDLIRADVSRDEADEMREQVGRSFEETDDRILLVYHGLTAATNDLAEQTTIASTADTTIAATYGNLIFDDLFHSLSDVKVTQQNAKQGLDEFLAAVDRAAALEDDYRARMKRTLIERLAVAALVLATLSLVGGLRWRFESEVRSREQARAEIEVAAQEREKENWIALTAGLTHTVGNDILAYDAYAEEALDALADHGARHPDLPPVIEKNLRFIHESNKARLAFIKFLDEFARARKRVGAGARPAGLTAIPIEPLLRRVRAQVGRTEIADLPRDSNDPQVVAQIKKLTELPLDVAFASDREDDRTITRGQRGVLEFFCYELFKNALRNGSGERPLRVEVEKSAGRVRLRFLNDLAVTRIEKGGRTLFQLPRYSTMEPCGDDELRARVEAILADCFEPGRGGGTGLGLFLIRYFAREYYSGSVSARLADWSARTVAFELDLPDDLESVKTAEART